MIDGFDSAVVGMKVGDTKTVTLQPKEAYGEVNLGAYTNLSRMLSLMISPLLRADRFTMIPTTSSSWV